MNFQPIYPNEIPSKPICKMIDSQTYEIEEANQDFIATSICNLLQEKPSNTKTDILELYRHIKLLQNNGAETWKDKLIMIIDSIPNIQTS